MFPGASRVLRDGRHSVYFSRLVSGPPLSSRYPAILVAAILSALLAPTWVRNFSAFISSRRLSLSKAAAFGMLSDRPMHKGRRSAPSHSVRPLGRRRNQTCIDRDALAEPSTVSSPSATMPFIAWQGLVCGRFPIIFEHLFKTLDMALCLFAVCHNRLRKLGISAALAILGGVRKIIFSAQ
jgi:hypothetical protein